MFVLMASIVDPAPRRCLPVAAVSGPGGARRPARRGLPPGSGPWDRGRVDADRRQPLTLRPAGAADVPAAAAVLAAAFADDPVLGWLTPVVGERRRRLARLFAAEIRHHHLAGGGVEVAVDGDGVVRGAAVWDPPGRWRWTRREQLRAAPAIARALGSYRKRGTVMDRSLGAVHPDRPHWYLATIGVDPAARGGGFGSALLRSRLQRADARAVPAYLESSKQENLPIYARFGFTETGRVDLPGGPSLWTMWREPR